MWLVVCALNDIRDELKIENDTDADADADYWM
jgi:hypothetical protein